MARVSCIYRAPVKTASDRDNTVRRRRGSPFTLAAGPEDEFDDALNGDPDSLNGEEDEEGFDDMPLLNGWEDEDEDDESEEDE